MLPLFTYDNYIYNGETNNYHNIFYTFSELTPVFDITSPDNGSLIDAGQPITLTGNVRDYVGTWDNYDALDLTVIDNVNGSEYNYFTHFDDLGNFVYTLSGLPSQTPGPNAGYIFRFTLDNTTQGINFFESQTPDYKIQVTRYIPVNPYNSNTPYDNYTKTDPGTWYLIHNPGETPTDLYNSMTGYIGPALESVNSWFINFNSMFDPANAVDAGTNIANGFKTAHAYINNLNQFLPVYAFTFALFIDIAFEIAIITAKAVFKTIQTIKP